MRRTTPPALPSQVLADYCLAHLPQIHAVSGLTESDIRNATTLLRAAPDVLQNLRDSRDAVTYYHEHEGCPELLKKRRAALALARDRIHPSPAPPLSRTLHAPTEFPMPDAAQALFQGLLMMIERLYWNRDQEAWDRIQDPGIPGLQWTPYDWHDDSPDAQAPNFAFCDAPAHLHGMEIRWYKHPGRGLTCSRMWNYTQWGEWYDACLAHLTRYDTTLHTNAS